MVILPGATTMVSPSAAPAKRDRKPTPPIPARVTDDRRKVRREEFIGLSRKIVIAAAGRKLGGKSVNKTRFIPSRRRQLRANIEVRLHTPSSIPLESGADRASRLRESGVKRPKRRLSGDWQL